MSSVVKAISAPAIRWSGLPAIADTGIASNPMVLTYTTALFYSVDTEFSGAKVFLTTVGDKYALRHPILVTLKEAADDEYVACFEEAKLARSAETAREAINWLKSSIVTLYDVLRKKDLKTLGPLPTRQLKVLGEYLVAELNPKA